MLNLVLTGFATSLGLIVAIGAQNSFVLQQGLRRKHVLPVVLICALSDAILISAGIAGMGGLIEQHPQVLTLSRFGGAAFLLFYGIQAAKRAWGKAALTPDNTPDQPLKTAVLTCLGLTFLNPHVYLDTVLLLGTLGGQYGSTGKWLFAAGAAFASVCWFFCLAYGARLLAPLFSKPLAWKILDGSIAVMMASLSATLFMGMPG
jgi:L-lysine exporter family protein LysE/ArgO